MRKLCHDVRWEKENPSCLARNAHTVPCAPPPVPEPAAAQVKLLCQRSPGPLPAQSSQALRAASLLALGSLPSLGSGTTAGRQQHPSAAASGPAPPLCSTPGSEHLGEEKRKNINHSNSQKQALPTKYTARAGKKLRVIVSLELKMLQKLISNYKCFDGKRIGCCVQAVAGLFRLNGLAILLQCACTLPQYSPLETLYELLNFPIKNMAPSNSCVVPVPDACM